MAERVLLSADEMARTIHRLAHEIVEKNGGPSDLVLLGIRTRGAHLVERIAVKIATMTGAAPMVGAIDVSRYRDDKSAERDVESESAVPPELFAEERKLPLSSNPHVYEKPGRYSIMVKVVDIFGNDTSQVFETEVK